VFIGYNTHSHTKGNEPMKYSHAYDFAFEVDSLDEDADDVTGAALRVALLKRLNTLSDEELIGACGHFDVMEAE
jgi:hypothetical protein